MVYANMYGNIYVLRTVGVLRRYICGATYQPLQSIVCFKNGISDLAVGTSWMIMDGLFTIMYYVLRPDTGKCTSPNEED